MRSEEVNSEDSYVVDDIVPSPASTVSAPEEEINLMDMDTNVDDIIECIPQLPGMTKFFLMIFKII